jgi:hypothetical protein
MSRPLLLVCTEVYPGPWVPTMGLEGRIEADGMVEGIDEVVIQIRDTLEMEPDTVIVLEEDCEVKVDLKYSLIRALRTKSSGREVSVWLK